MGRAGWVTLLVTLAVVSLALWHFDPIRDGGVPGCGFRALTGHRCPGCGATHALHHLLHGRLLEAFSANALVLLAPVLMGLQWAAARRWPRVPGPTRPASLLAWAVLAALWAVVREVA